MPSLRVHVKDPAIGMTSQSNCELVADCVGLVSRWAAHPLLGWLCPYRKQALTLALLAATFSRVKGVPEPLAPQLDARLRTAMGEPKYD